MEVSIVTVVLLIGFATLVYADWRPGPAGKQKITSIIIGIIRVPSVKHFNYNYLRFDSNTLCLRYLYKYTLDIS